MPEVNSRTLFHAIFLLGAIGNSPPTIAGSLMIHIGNRIKEVFDAMPRRYSVVWLARELNCTRPNVYHIFERPSIDTDLLARLCQILNHDFFADLSADLYSQELT